jgi:phosphatidylglycerol lysyltransferase
MIFGVALEVLRIELRAVSWRELTRDVLGMPAPQLALAVLLTALNYAVLTGYDFVAFASLGKSLPASRIAMTSLLAYGIANTVGLSALSGASVRYRFYARWGVTAAELSRIVFSYSVTFWLGLLALGGLSLAISPLPAALMLPVHAIIAPFGWVLMLAPVGYVVATIVRRTPVRLRQFELPLPPPRLAMTQLALSAADWTLAGAVLYVLLPPSDLSFLEFLGAFLAAILLGMASLVPGGIGVFEGIMVLLLKPYLSSAQLLPALVVFRAIYYLLPFLLGVIGLVADELHQHRAGAVRAATIAGRAAEHATPIVLAILTFASGLVLLLSNATPASPGRLAQLERWLPLGMIEASHFLASVAGAALLLVSQGLARRINGAFYLALAMIAVGIATSLLKGFDYEQAALLTVVIVVLWSVQHAFDRPAAFFETRFSPGWIAAVAAAMSAAIWLGLFAFKHVTYSQELWWQFALHGEASRFLRASVGAVVVLLLFSIARLIGYAPHATPAPSDADLASAAQVIAAQPSTSPNLVYLRDKAVLFDQDRTGFVMYGVQGRTWVALGDPVGAPSLFSTLVRTFIERCDDFGGVPAFYEVSKNYLHHYADFGLTFVKLGEEARVDLHAFSLNGGHGARHRQALRRLDKDGATFRIVEAREVGAILKELRRVSDEWLSEKSTGEKGFSLGFFDEMYIGMFPVAVVERGGRIVAFANLWPGSAHHELSVDLMRYGRDAPKGVMEALLVHLFVWGQAQGYQWFALGMAPLSGFERSPVASLWSRLGGFVYEHGESVYNFEGLRAYKDRFDPTWEPRYLAYHGARHLPRVLADISALIAGGYRRIFLK